MSVRTGECVRINLFDILSKVCAGKTLTKQLDTLAKVWYLLTLWVKVNSQIVNVCAVDCERFKVCWGM